MKQEDFDDFVDIIQAVSEQYGKRLSDSVLALYWQGLSNYDLPAVRDALGRHLRNTDNGQFMPKIADIIRMMQGSSLDAALSAWAKVDRAVRQVGPYESVVFDDPIIHRVLHDMGGWMALSTKTDEEWPFIAKEFENRYRGFKARNEKVDYPSKLIGLAEAHNAKEGQAVNEPLLIGDKEKARTVYESGKSGANLLTFSRMSDLLPRLSSMVTEK